MRVGVNNMPNINRANYPITLNSQYSKLSTILSEQLRKLHANLRNRADSDLNEDEMKSKISLEKRSLKYQLLELHLMIAECQFNIAFLEENDDPTISADIKQNLITEAENEFRSLEAERVHIETRLYPESSDESLNTISERIIGEARLFDLIIERADQHDVQLLNHLKKEKSDYIQQKIHIQPEHLQTQLSSLIRQQLQESSTLDRPTHRKQKKVTFDQSVPVTDIHNPPKPLSDNDKLNILLADFEDELAARPREAPPLTEDEIIKELAKLIQAANEKNLTVYQGGELTQIAMLPAEKFLNVIETIIEADGLSRSSSQPAAADEAAKKTAELSSTSLHSQPTSQRQKVRPLDPNFFQTEPMTIAELNLDKENDPDMLFESLRNIIHVMVNENNSDLGSWQKLREGFNKVLTMKGDNIDDNAKNAIERTLTALSEKIKALEEENNPAQEKDSRLSNP